jgi:hypothetical protein
MNADRLDRLLKAIPAPDATRRREATVAEARAKVARERDAPPARLGARPARRSGRAGCRDNGLAPLGPGLRALRPAPATARREGTVARARAEQATRRADAGRAFTLHGLRLAVTAALAALLVGAGIVTTPGQAVTSWVAERLGLAGVGGPPSMEKRPFRTRSSAVIATGRAPDGARYEAVLDTTSPRDRNRKPDRKTGVCTGLEWPDVPGGARGVWTCGPAFPGQTGLGRRGVYAKAFGVQAIAYVEASAWPVLTGFSRPEVRRLRVLYTDRDRRRRDAPVDLFRLTGALWRRVGASRPVGYWVAFLPPSSPQYDDTAPETRRLFDRRAITVIAYDRAGGELGRTYHSNYTLTWP